MAEILAVGIKKLYYADPVSSVTKPYVDGDATSGLSAVETKALIATATEVENVHQDTWQYEEADASVTNYKNQLNKKVYYSVADPGDVQISFTIGAWSYNTKADLQGGTASATSWSRPSSVVNIRKSIIALTETGQYIVFTNAAIVARGTSADGGIKLAVAATAMEPSIAGLESEKWFEKSTIDAAVIG